MATIIIPAHNEAAVIADTLSAVVSQVSPDDRVIVVSNGSQDSTEAIARQFAPAVTVVSTPVPSKAGALNLGEQYAAGFPRIYLDADVRLGPGALERLKTALADGGRMAVSPGPVMDFTGASWAVRAYYRIWLALPYCRNGMIGAGTYALSEAGRARFGAFPDLIADDGYVRALFREDERGNVAGACAIVRAPHSLRWLIRIKRRSRLGRMQLAARHPELMNNEQKAYGSGALALLRRPRHWVSGLVYLYVTVISSLLAQAQRSALTAYRWERDESSRKSMPGRS